MVAAIQREYAIQETPDSLRQKNNYKDTRAQACSYSKGIRYSGNARFFVLEKRVK